MPAGPRLPRRVGMAVRQTTRIQSTRSLPRCAMLPARMPNVSPNRDIGRCFAEARRLSAGRNGLRWVVIIAPDGTLIKVPVPPPAEADQSLLRDVRAALSPEGGEAVTGLTITSINNTGGIQKRGRSFFQILELIPNLSYLVGAACLGNTLVAFEGADDVFPAGVADADVLVVDDGMVPFLRPDWAAIALKELRELRILQFGRDGRLSYVSQLIEVERPGWAR
jgi:hypothetical protein